MAYKMFAAIYVGSSEISMKIFQVNGRKSFRQIDSVSRILELGRDTYREGKLSQESIRMICEELNGLKNKMDEYKITEILGLSHKERMEVANVVRYNPLYLPSKDKISAELDGCDYIVIAKLAAILRIANILDKSHMQKIEDISVTLKEDKLIILAKTYEDISLEAGLFEARADFFEQIYGIRPVLRVKRSV